MSNHDNHDNLSKETKPVSFTVPFILAGVTLVLIFSILSMCDPKKHSTSEHGGHNEHSHSNSQQQHESNSKIDHVEPQAPSETNTTENEKTHTGAH